MKLTDTERLILANQYEILGRLNDDEDSLKISQLLRKGYTSLYLDYLDLSPTIDPQVEDFVFEVLNMYSEMFMSVPELNNRNGIKDKDLIFPGFDGNKESIYLGFLLAVRDDELYHDLLGIRDLNSHVPVVAKYCEMLDKRREMGPLDDISRSLSREQILDLLSVWHR